MREFGIFYTYATHIFVVSVRYYSNDYLCIIPIIDAESVPA